MKRISKEPSLKKQELVDVAMRLYLERGYESVTVRDILAEMNGTPGMFYYYFDSSQDLYREAMEQFTAKALIERIKVLQNKEITIKEQLLNILDAVDTDSDTFYDYFIPTSKKEKNSESMAHILLIISNFLNAMVAPVSRILLEALETGIISENSVVNEENAEQIATYILYGTNSILRTSFEDKTTKKEKRQIILTLLSKILDIEFD